MDGRQNYDAGQDEAQLALQLQGRHDEQQQISNEAILNMGANNSRLGQLPLLQRRGRGSIALRLPNEAIDAQEVFGEDFYEQFPWARGVDPFDEDATQWLPAERYVENFGDLRGLQPDDNAEVPPAIEFVNRLISLELDDLEQDNQACPICLTKYREGEEGEMPVLLPCAPNHVVGKECLLIWLTDVGDVVHHASCPICRTECVKEKRVHIGTKEGLRQRLRDVNYLLTGPSALTLTQEGRDRWEKVKSYVKAYLEVKTELQRHRERRFVMFLRMELRTNPNFTTNMISNTGFETRQYEFGENLDHVIRSGLLAEFLEAADAAFGGELVGEIASRLEANIQPGLLRMMEEVYEDCFGDLAMESAELFDDDDDEDWEAETDVESVHEDIEMNDVMDDSEWCESCQGWHLHPHGPIADSISNAPLNSGLTVEYLEDFGMDRPTSALSQVSSTGLDRNA